MTASWTLTIDCRDPGRLATFWKAALGYVDAPAPVGFASREEWLRHHEVPEDEWNDGAALTDPEGRLPSLSFLKVPEGKVVKNRIHLDLQVGGGRGEPWEIRWPRVTAAVDRLRAAGATVIGTFELRGRPDHVVMADPEGNEFCVL